MLTVHLELVGTSEQIMDKVAADLGTWGGVREWRLQIDVRVAERDSEGTVTKWQATVAAEPRPAEPPPPSIGPLPGLEDVAGG